MSPPTVQLPFGVFHIFARVAPFLGVGARFSGGQTALAGPRGPAWIDIPVEAGIEDSIDGERGALHGDLGFGASVMPSATRSLPPFVGLSAFGGEV